MKQNEINLNVQERLRGLSANQQVTVAFLVSLIETHPNPAALRQQFALHYETMHAKWLNSALAEDWFDEANDLRLLLDGSFDRPRKA